MQPPNILNRTIPAGMALYFDTGNGFRHLGDIDVSSLQIEPKNTELAVESQLSGRARTAKILIIKQEEQIKFKLVEPVVENLRAFLTGGAIAGIGSGTAAEVDQKLTLAGEVEASLGQYGLSAVTVRQFLDACLVYDGAAYTDHSAEADSLAGTPFTTLTDANDALYFGKLTPFKQVYIDFATNGVYGAVVVEYWDGSAWQAVSGLTGGAAALAADGKMGWNVPGDWAKKVVNDSEPMYWLKITATTPWTTPATINCIRQNAVRNTDYVLDPGQVTPEFLAGRVGRLTGGFLADGEEVMVSYTYTTWTSLKFPVASGNYLQGAARLEVHPAAGLQGNRHIPLCQLKPDGAMSLDAKKEWQIPMMLEVLDDYANNPTAPFGYWEALSES